ncbi:MAG: hypothetical protein ACK5KO_04305 [Arachnia sp.]
MSRRILTQITVDELLAAGHTELQLDEGDIVTALAKEHAQQHGLRLVPAAGGRRGVGAAAPGQPESNTSPPPASSTVEAVDERNPDATVVRRAVIAALGSEPAGLDAIIARIMN